MNRRASRETAVLFSVGDACFAIAANAVEEIRGLEGLVPLGDKRGRVRSMTHTLERCSKQHIVIDAALHFGMPSAKPERLLVLRASLVAVLVGCVDRMQEIAVVYSLPRAFRGQERQWYGGLVLLHDAIVPLVNPESFLSEINRLRLASPMSRPDSEMGATAEGAACA